MTTRPPITSLGFCIRITVASSLIIELLLSRLVGWRLSSSSCQAFDPEQVGGAGDAERHPHGDDDVSPGPAGSSFQTLSLACSKISETPSTFRTVIAWMYHTRQRRHGVC